MVMTPAELASLSEFFNCLAAGDYETPVRMGMFLKESGHKTIVSPSVGAARAKLTPPEEVLRTDPAPELATATATVPDDPLEAAKLAVDALNLRSPHSFTFTRMLHDVYGPEKFAQMVEEVLRASRATFQPLPLELKGRRERKGSEVFESHSNNAAHIRALKKRCVARKITPIGGVSGGNGWLYDVAVASADDEVFDTMRRRRRTASNAGPESPTSDSFADTFAVEDSDEDATLVDPQGSAGLGKSPLDETFTKTYEYSPPRRSAMAGYTVAEGFGIKRRYSDSSDVSDRTVRAVFSG